MKDEYDFRAAKRGAVANTKGKTRITIMLDDAVIQAAREMAESAGMGYQTMINNILRQYLLPKIMHSHRAVAEDRTKVLQVINDGISPSEVQALEKQLMAVASELKRVLGRETPDTHKTKAGQ